MKFGIGYYNKFGFMVTQNNIGSVAFCEDNNNQSTMKLAENIVSIGKKFIENSNLIASIRTCLIRSKPGFEVELRESINPINLQYHENCKEFLKLKSSEEGKTWKWERDPRIGVLAFEILKSHDSDGRNVIPLSAFAYRSSKKNGEYVPTYHPNVSEDGKICMGGLADSETLEELSVGSIVKMLSNMAIYSSYFRPKIIDISEHTHIICDSSNIRSAIDSLNTGNIKNSLLAKFGTVERWL